MPKAVIVTGSRYAYSGSHMGTIRVAIDREGLCEGDVVIHGGASGADTIVGYTLDVLYPLVREIRCPARWKALGKQAGPVRNIAMAEVAYQLEQFGGYEVRIIAFPGGAFNRGTTHMISTARRFGWKNHTVWWLDKVVKDEGIANIVKDRRMNKSPKAILVDSEYRQKPDFMQLKKKVRGALDDLKIQKQDLILYHSPISVTRAIEHYLTDRYEHPQFVPLYGANKVDSVDAMIRMAFELQKYCGYEVNAVGFSDTISKPLLLRVIGAKAHLEPFYKWAEVSIQHKGHYYEL